VVRQVGIVGRTGSGKSTTMLTLLRMYELEQGQIFIDGVDIATVGLHRLRKKLAIIPQDPVVFNSTVKFNLDPFDEFSEQVGVLYRSASLCPEACRPLCLC
jgi:ATP-binding cassette subfamily C (CFTR/MRP) protein 1